MELAGKVAIVTGGASGIGFATAKAFLDKGAKVVIGDYNEEGGQQAEQQLKESSDEVAFVSVDVSREESVEKMVSATVERFGRVDIIVNNAGIGEFSVTHELTYEDYHKVIAVNQDGVFFGAKHAIKKMLEHGEGGAIVNTSSILGSVGEGGAFAYNASKGAVNLMTKSLALQYAEHKIRVNAVAPGYVETGLVNRETLGELYDVVIARHPVGRIGQPEEIAHAIVFLVENEFVTGTTIMVDGGYTTQ
ncbi:SDR family NAD(P)-dependent oxidoreductase [Planococcus donghaensis]|uniref:Short-chain dehydrogenase n=1 Tax=Planococcus donghaensis TaxID=414778 RepID=A0A1C7EDX4_9BACL|nr:SDR family oxidoreductase [Planococcus donghaensis]ANU21958.1 short-chain dehydrogenase [Planococcus donghaensis]